MVKQILAAVGLTSFLVPTVFAQEPRLQFCGPEPCLVPLPNSCEDLILNYIFLGNCCRLTPIPSTGGCRVEVGSIGPNVPGNCAWTSRCEPCDPDSLDRCGFEFQTTGDTLCPDLDFDVLAIQRAWNETPSPSTVSPAPTPAIYFDGPGTCAPSMAPVEGGGNDTSGATATLSLGAAVFVTVLSCATGLASF